MWCISFRFLVAFFALWSILDQAQGQSPVTHSDILIGNQQWLAGNYESAYFHYQSARNEALAHSDTEVLAYALTFSGKYLSRMGRTEEATATIDSAVTLRDSLHPAGILARREKADLFMAQGDFEQGVALHRANAQIAEALPSKLDSIKAICFHTMGTTSMIMEQWDSAMYWSERALDIRKDILPPDHIYLAFGENLIGSVYLMKESYEEAKPHVIRSIEITEKRFGPTHPQVLKMKANLAILYTDLGESREALAIYESCLPYLDKVQQDGQIVTLLNLGSTYMTLRDFPEALATFDQVEQIIDQYPDVIPIAPVYISGERATIFLELDEPEKALYHVNQALEQQTKLYGPESNQLQQEFLRKGSILTQLNRYSEASEALDEALRLSEVFLGPNAVNRARVFEWYGELWMKQAEPDQALAYYKQANEVYAGSEVQWNLADTHTKMAEAWQLKGNPDSARTAYNQAWKYISPELAFNMSPTREVFKFWDVPPMRDLLLSMGDFHRRDTSNISSLKAALTCYELALAVADSQRYYYASDASREFLISRLIPEYETILHLCWMLSRKPRGDIYFEKAFSLAEKSKAANLRDYLRGKRALAFAGVPEEMVAQEREFRRKLAQLSGPDLSREKIDEKRKLRVAYQAFLHKLQVEYPSYYQLRYTNQEVSFSRIMAELTDDDCLYSYFMGDSALFIFRIGLAGVNMSRISFAKEPVKDLLASWTSIISTKPDVGIESLQQIANQPHQLSKLLLPDYHSGDHLTIIPDAALGYLPFETLLSDLPQEDDFRKWPWIWKTSTISYIYAAEIWLQQRKNKRTDKSAAYVGFAPDFQGDQLASTRSDLGALAYNKAEVEQAAEWMKGQPFTGSMASEVQVKQSNGHHLVRHFATHAVADLNNRMNSRLFLHPGNDSLEDGILYMHELYGLRLPSPLTVLSACQTGQGPLLRGEGIMSLARAFQYAGSQRVLTTLWHADDKSSADLSTSFFRSVSQGIPVEAALQQSRGEFFENADAFHGQPYFWGNFVLIGDRGVIEMENRPWVIYGGIILLAILIIVGIKWMKGRYRKLS
ncbi:MAG: CHAT domain-containing protein [Bacteroidota bacterium]